MNTEFSSIRKMVLFALIGVPVHVTSSNMSVACHLFDDMLISCEELIACIKTSFSRRKSASLILGLKVLG